MATVQPHSLTLPCDWLCVFVCVCVTRGTRGDRLLGQVEVQRRRRRGGGRRRAQREQERPTVRRAVTHTSTGDTDPNKYLMCPYGRAHTSAGLSGFTVSTLQLGRPPKQHGPSALTKTSNNLKFIHSECIDQAAKQQSDSLHENKHQWSTTHFLREILTFMRQAQDVSLLLLWGFSFCYGGSPSAMGVLLLRKQTIDHRSSVYPTALSTTS